MKFQLTPTPTPNDQVIVADSREKVADSREPKAYDLSKLLNDPEKVVEPNVKLDKQTSTSNVSTSNKKEKRSRSDYHKEWAANKAQISIRVSADLKAQIDSHTSERGEKLAAFVVRAIKEQMERDSR